MQTLIKKPIPIIESEITPRNSMLLKGVTWQTFKTLMEEVGENRAWRITYDQEVLEIRTPLQNYEMAVQMLNSFIVSMVDELDIEAMNIGSLTLERNDLQKSIEPDSCFYIQNESLVRGKDITLPEFPPPDLTIESDDTNYFKNRLKIYASLQVPEVWIYHQQQLIIYVLQNGQYEKCDRSLAFPFLPITEIPNFIEQSLTIGQRTTVKLFRKRIQEIFKQETI